MSPSKSKKAAAPDEYLAALAEGLGPEAAAAEAGLSPEGLDKLRDHPEGKHAEALAIAKVETALFQLATDKSNRSGKLTAMIFWLANRSPERWKHVARIGRDDDSGGRSALEEAIRGLNE